MEADDLLGRLGVHRARRCHERETGHEQDDAREPQPAPIRVDVAAVPGVVPAGEVRVWVIGLRLLSDRVAREVRVVPRSGGATATS